MATQIRKLTGQEKEAFWKILLGAFNRTNLAMMLSFKLNKDLGDITTPGPFEEVVFQLIHRAEMEDWTYRLLLAARETRPDNGELVTFAQEVGLAPRGTPGQPALQKIIMDTGTELDLMSWREHLGRIEGQVCRVELGTGASRGMATGFLVGPEVVITAHNVMQPVVEGKIVPGEVILRFDYKRLPGGVELSKGQEYRLATAGDWLVDWSPYSSADLGGGAGGDLPGADELNYALLRVAGSPGYEAPGGKPDPHAPPRGWIPIPDTAPSFQPGGPLFIVHQPRGKPLQVNHQSKGMIGLNESGTRVRYQIDSGPGSSGAPLFDGNWCLIALHHARRPNYREGIPFHLILDLLKKRGLERYLGGTGP